MKRSFIFQILLLIFCALLILFTDIGTAAAKEAVGRCLNIIIPSLFVFMAVSSIIVKSGAYRILSIPFYPLAKYVFKIPYELFSVMFISNIAGFSVGASMLTQLVRDKKITAKTASVMQCYCYGGGPSFSLGVIGMVIFNDKLTGLIIFLSSVLANLTIALILNRVYNIKALSEKEKAGFSASDFIECIESSGRSMLMICALIITFAVALEILTIPLSSVLEHMGVYLSEDAAVLIRSVMEISSVSALKNGSLVYLPIISAIFCYGGICILVQVICTVRNSYSLSLFFITRLPCAMLAFLYSKGLVYLFADKIKECMAYEQNVVVNLNNFLPSFCLILMIFSLTFSKGVAFFKKI